MQEPVGLAVGVGGRVIPDLVQVAEARWGWWTLYICFWTCSKHHAAVLRRQQAIVGIAERGGWRRCFSAAKIL